MPHDTPLTNWKQLESQLNLALGRAARLRTETRARIAGWPS